MLGRCWHVYEFALSKSLGDREGGGMRAFMIINKYLCVLSSIFVVVELTIEMCNGSNNKIIVLTLL